MKTATVYYRGSAPDEEISDVVDCYVRDGTFVFTCRKDVIFIPLGLLARVDIDLDKD